jgi:arylsulfatase
LRAWDHSGARTGSSTATAGTPSTDLKAPSRHTARSFEAFGNRALHHGGELAPSISPPGGSGLEGTLDNNAWELYDTRTDFSLANHVAAKHPEKLQELWDLFPNVTIDLR